MPVFEYTARTSDGRIRRGVLTARDVADLEEQLKAQELVLTSSNLGRKKSPALSFFGQLQSVPTVQKMFFTQYLQVMIRAGFSISRALDTLSQQTTSKYFRKVLTQIREDVEGGMPLAKSMEKHPRVFSELYVSMVAAGESSGKLDEVLRRLAEKMKKDHGLVSKIKGALTYPVIIVIAMVAVAISMTVVVIPKLTSIFEETGAKLPLATRILIAISDFLMHNGLLTVGVIVIFAFAFVRVIRTNRGRRALDAILLKLPIIGPIITKISLARFSRSLSSLLETNIPIIDTFLIISRTMGSVHYRQALEEAAGQLKTGSSIAPILHKYPRLFPQLATQMIAIGEESGSLDSIAGELAAFYEEEVDQTTANLSTIIEPILMLLLGVGVAAMAVAVILPIYSLSQQIG